MELVIKSENVTKGLKCGFAIIDMFEGPPNDKQIYLLINSLLKIRNNKNI